MVSFSPGKAVLKSGRGASIFCSGCRRTRTPLAIDAGIEVARGIVTDEHCRTSADDIYASGDCSESIDSGDRRKTGTSPLAQCIHAGECSLDTIDFELICEKPQLMAFSRTQREQMLGGVLR